MPRLHSAVLHVPELNGSWMPHAASSRMGMGSAWAMSLKALQRRTVLRSSCASDKYCLLGPSASVTRCFFARGAAATLLGASRSTATAGPFGDAASPEESEPATRARAASPEP